MNSDSQQPQNPSAPPEAPQIPPASPVPPVSPAPQPAAFPEQPTQPTQYSQPTEPQTFGAQPVAPPVTPQSPVPNQFGAPAPSQFSQPTPFPQTAPPQNPAVMPAMPQPKKKLGLIIGLVVGGVILIGALVAVVFIFLLPSGKVAESDLVSATTDDTTYLRPKQWEGITVDSVSGYGDKKGKDDKSTAAIFVKKGSYVQSGVKKATSSQLESFRDSTVDNISSSEAESEVKKTGVCDSVQDVKTTKSSVETSNMVGIVRVAGSCVRSDGTYKVVIYEAIGNDGYLRFIYIMSTESLWKQNEAVFNKMLDSADQS